MLPLSRPLGRCALTLALVALLCACEQPTTGPADPAAVALDDVPDSLRSDALAAALTRFAEARPPSAADSATLRHRADSLHAEGRSLRNQAPIRARAALRQALRTHGLLGDSTQMAEGIEDVGFTYRYQGRYRAAMRHHRRALALHRRLGNRERAANVLTHIGIIRDDQGQYEKAFLRFQEALALNRALDNRGDMARTLNSIGIIRWRQGEYNAAIARFEESIDTYRAIEDQEAIAALLNNIGVIHRDQGELDTALARFREALRIKREIGDREGIARTLNNIGTVHGHRGQQATALARYRAALRIEREIGDRRSISENLHDIGRAHLRAGQLRAATDTLQKAVALADTLRLNATSPDARRSLLSAQVGAYRALTTAYVRARRPDSALRALERARARLLADHLAGTARGDTTFSIPSPATLRRTLGPQEAALLYANAGTEWPLTVLAVTQDTVHARELPDATVRAEIGEAYAAPLRRLDEGEGPLSAAFTNDDAPSPDTIPSLAESIRLYRHHFTQDDVQPGQTDLARRLHALFVAPVADVLRPVETVTVVPTGPLGYLPFETLRNPEGQYLIQQNHVRYAQSLTVLRQLQERDYPRPGPSGSQKPLLALGGAAYDAPSPPDNDVLLAEARRAASIEAEERGTALLRAAERQREQGRSPRRTYARLGYDRWSPLYGTRLEVQKLKRTVGPGATVLTGTAASEPRVRRLSASGALAQYRHLHFATHGLTVPTAPQLSALVLSQAGVSDRLAARDGYLTMPEIADLDLRADVAVLSACRTGLGRIVAGEGVVTLSHAFLRAGANATLVSQWRVLDWSTQQFMTAVYRRAEAPDTSFAEAVTQVKRAFIAGEFGTRNQDPLRWAAFVYYGRT